MLRRRHHIYPLARPNLRHPRPVLGHHVRPPVLDGVARSDIVRVVTQRRELVQVELFGVGPGFDCRLGLAHVGEVEGTGLELGDGRVDGTAVFVGDAVVPIAFTSY